MSFTFKPISEAEASGLLQPGTYDFQVKTAENAVSKKGNPMIKMNVTVWGHDGREHFIYDYLMEAMAYKLRHFCEAVDLMDKYQEGQFDATDCVGKSGKCKIKIEEAGEYPARNSIQDYVKPAAKANGEAKQANDFIEDDIMF